MHEGNIMIVEEKVLEEALLSEDELLEEEQFEPETIEEESPPLDLEGKDRRLFTHPYDFIIRSLKDQVDDGTLILADNFQRRRVWDNARSSRLIESLLINVPIPVCYFAEVGDACSVVDGQQRLTAIYRYIDNQFSLSSLRVRSDLNKKRFHELGVADKRTIQNRSIRCILILKESDSDIRFDVFDRLNSTSVKLNAQELRNSLYRGDLNELILELSAVSAFQEIRGVKNIDKRMQDCEMVLRFFAFHFQPEKYRGVLSKFLDNYLEQGQKLNLNDTAQHKEVFLRVVDDINYVFGKYSFRRYNSEKKQWDKVINKSVYDIIIIIIYFAKIESDVIRANKEGLIKALQKLCSDVEFNSSISGATSATNRIQARLDKWYESISSLGIEVERIRVGLVVNA
jgi:uncharacterized protein with ParB-like and HNH nuclease domain